MYQNGHAMYPQGRHTVSQLFYSKIYSK